MRLFLCSILMFLPVIYCGKSQVNVRIDTTVCFQTFSGWESASFLTSECDTNYALLRDAVLPVLIDSVGITRFRLEVRSGSENSVDNYRYYLDANCPSGNDSNYLKWRASRYATVNDNNDTSINFDGFHFTELDLKIERLIMPFVELLSSRGIRPYINLCYVAFTGQIKNGIYIHNNPDEYAEFVLATYLHIFNKYGFTPDAWELVLEPDNVSQWNGTLLGTAIVKSAERLKKYGFTPKFIGPSNTNMTNAVKYFDDMAKVPGAIDYLEEISYHRYGGVTQQSLLALADRGKQYNKKTSMLEWWFDNAKYNILHEDITVGNVSSFQQATIPGFFDIDMTNPKQPKIKIKDITQYNRIYYTLIKPGAVRKGTYPDSGQVTAVAAINSDGLLALILKSDIDTTVAIEGLPFGNYSAITTNNIDKYKIVQSFDVKNNEQLNFSIKKGLFALKQNKKLSDIEDYKNLSVAITPNPASDYIEIKLPRPLGEGWGEGYSSGVSPVTQSLSNCDDIRIYDVLGVEVTTRSDLTPGPSPRGEGGSLRLDLSHLSPGVYFVKVGDVVRKFVKM